MREEVKRCGHGFSSLRALPAPSAAPRQWRHLANATCAFPASEAVLTTQSRRATSPGAMDGQV